METIVSNKSVHVLIEQPKDPKADKSVRIYGSVEALLDAEKNPELSRYKIKKGLDEKGKFILSNYERRIEIRKTNIIKRTKKNE